jgi:hypothetical protein
MHALAEFLIDCVDGGASVSFMHPLSMPSALATWNGEADAVAFTARPSSTRLSEYLHQAGQ